MGPEDIIVAGEGGVPSKPDPKPFRLCPENRDCEADEAVCVGDDWRIDVCGAKDAGLNAIWIKHHSFKCSWPAVETSVPVITSLQQLLDLKSIIDNT